MRQPLDKVYLRPQYALHYRHAARVRWSSEARPEYTALLLFNGELRCDIGGAHLSMRGGGALLLDPGGTALASGRDVEYLAITLSPSFVLDGASRIGLIGIAANVTFRGNLVETDERLSRLAQDLVGELLREEMGQEAFVGALMEQTAIHLLRHHSNVRRSDEMELSRVGLVDRRIRRAIELMHAHLSRELPLEEIAAAAYLSPFHFARLFKKLTGASPHAFLATLRVNRAQTLLAETDLSISEVSARVGYSSPSHFTKAFRQATGLTPRAFRNALVGSQ